MSPSSPTYHIAQYPDPREIDADTPQEVAQEAVRHYISLLTEVIGYAERVETAVRNSAWQDALDGAPAASFVGSVEPLAYGDLAQETGLAARANGALGTALSLAQRLENVLQTPPLNR